MNWGHGITIFLTLFVLFIGGLVYLTTRSTVDLEAEDYYAQEIDYQDRIDALSMGGDYVDLFSVSTSDEGVVFTIDQSMTFGFEEGKVSFYRANDSGLDRYYDLDFDQETLRLPNSDFVKGLYEIRIEWTVDGIAHAQVRPFEMS